MYEYTIKCEKKYKKESKSQARVIDKALTKLLSTIENIESYDNQQFETVYNQGGNSVLKHDVYDKNFFAYKYIGQDRTCLRLLYKFNRIDNSHVVVELHDYYIKRGSAKGIDSNQKYIKEFEGYVENYIPSMAS